ncbi:unnamed protein product, partial [Nesidiocoris tenuis]
MRSLHNQNCAGRALPLTARKHINGAFSKLRFLHIAQKQLALAEFERLGFEEVKEIHAETVNANSKRTTVKPSPPRSDAPHSGQSPPSVVERSTPWSNAPHRGRTIYTTILLLERAVVFCSRGLGRAPECTENAIIAIISILDKMQCEHSKTKNTQPDLSTKRKIRANK